MANDGSAASQGRPDECHDGARLSDDRPVIESLWLAVLRFSRTSALGQKDDTAL